MEGAAAEGEQELPDGDTFRILIATDTHVGYNEKDKVRGNDAMNTFEEVMQTAKFRKADLVLHGGDLFHENKPTRKCLHQAMDLLRKYSLGPADVSFEVVPDPQLFPRGQVNFEDANMNVEMPFFMIHGNHDDPGGEGNLSAANLLEVVGLVNYFGRAGDLEDITVRPILMRKGRTQLAIYGLGNIRDERLHRAFQGGKVRFETPVNPEQWFHIMILHQNRHKGNKGGVPSKACIHEQMLPNFLDLVIWGHEHDCEVIPKESIRGEFFVVQPGSSVATALSAGETTLKHVAFIDVRGHNFRCVPVPLWTVRPFVMSEYALSESGLPKTDTEAIWSALAAEVEALIARGEEEVQRRQREVAKLNSLNTDRKLEAPSLPLVRLRVEHSGYETINGQTFGRQFVDRVANPDEVLLFHRRGGGGAIGSRRLAPIGDVLEIEELPGPAEDNIKIQDIIYKYIEGDQNLQLLSEPDLNDAVQVFVHRSEPMAIERFVREAVEATNQAVLQESRAAGQEEIRAQIQDRAESIRQSRLAAAASGGTPGMEVPGAGDSLRMLGGGAPESVPKDEPVDYPASAAVSELAGDPMEALSTPRGRGRGGRGRGRAPVKRSQEDAGFAQPAPKVPRGGRGAPAAPSGAVSSGRGLRDVLHRSPGTSAAGGVPVAGGAALAGVTSFSSAPGGPAQAPAAAPTGFLSCRGGGAAADSAWGLEPPADLGMGGAGGAGSQGTPAPRRAWALRGPQ